MGLIRSRGHLGKAGYDVSGTREQRPAPRGRFDDDLKAQAIHLMLDESKSVGAVARDLDLTESALRHWAECARADRTGGRTGLTGAERYETRHAPENNRELLMERDILTIGRGLSLKRQP